MEDKKIQVAFAAINKETETYIPSFEESEARGKNYINYGADNLIPEYLHGLFTEVNTLKSIICGMAKYVAGDDAKCLMDGFDVTINKKGDTLFDTIGDLARDYLIYGGFALQVIRTKGGQIGEIYYIDFRYLRTSKKHDLFWYSEEYGKKYARTSKQVVYPKFVPDAVDQPTSIIYVTNEKSQTYPTPRYSGALMDCEIERKIEQYHLASLDNGFAGSYLLNFLNGVPDDQTKDEIEKSVNEKFTGTANAGRILINFADSAENAATLSKLEIQDFGEHYTAAADRARQQIFVAFNATPNLFGLPTETTGFNSQEYADAFKLFNRTQIKPIQRLICDTFDKIFGMKNSIEITPFSLENNNEQTVD